jgi:hypothetical protein
VHLYQKAFHFSTLNSFFVCINGLFGRYNKFMADDDAPLETSSLPFSPEDLVRLSKLKKAVRVGKRSDFFLSPEGLVHQDELRLLKSNFEISLDQKLNQINPPRETFPQTHRPPRQHQHKSKELMLSLRNPEQAILKDFDRIRNLIEEKLKNDPDSQSLTPADTDTDISSIYYRKIKVEGGDLVLSTENGFVDVAFQKANMDLSRVNSSEDLTLHIEPGGEFYYYRVSSDYEAGTRTEKKYYLMDEEKKLDANLIDEQNLIRPILHSYLQD